MLAATIISSLFLMAGGALADASGPPDLRECPIEVGDPWDMGGGGTKLKGCQIRGSGSKWYVSYMWVGRRVDWHKTFATRDLAEDWVAANCES